jgi:hypothetical protein
MRALILSGIITLAGLLLVACGDKDEDTGADTAEAVEESAEETE